jgi:predicted ArsR family transcriptional regulator
MVGEAKVMEQKAGDHEYLHKDFHGALAFAIKYLDETYGPQAVTEYLLQVADHCYAPLTEQLKERGLAALEDHFEIYKREQGRFTVRYDHETLILEIHECPAISHLKKNGQLFSERYCESTAVVMDGICRNAGYRSSCTFEPGQGRCLQKFWKEA